MTFFEDAIDNTNVDCMDFMVCFTDYEINQRYEDLFLGDAL